MINVVFNFLIPLLVGFKLKFGLKDLADKI